MDPQEKQLTAKPTRDDFIKYISDSLISKGFKKDSEKELWVREQQIQTPGQTIVINNQRRDIPGQIKHIKFAIDIIGDGYAEDVKTERQDPFLEVDLTIFEEDNEIHDWPIFCMYYDDQLEFNNTLSQIFRI